MFLKVLCSKFKKLKQVQLPAIHHRFTMTCTTENRHQHIQIKWILSSFTVSLFMQSWKRRVCLFHLCRHRKSVKLSSKSLSNSLSEGQERHLWGLRCTHLWQRWIIEQRNWTHINIETNCPCGLQLGLFGLHMISVNHFFHREMVHFGLRQQGNQMCYFLPRSFHSRCTSGEKTCSEGTFVSQKSQSVPLLKRMLTSSAPMYSSYFHVSLSMIIRWSLLSMPRTPSMKKKKGFVVFGCYDKLCGRWWCRICHKCHNHSGKKKKIHKNCTSNMLLFQSWCVCEVWNQYVTWLQMRTPAVNNTNVTFPPWISLENSFHNSNFTADSKDSICFAISASSIWTATHCHTEIMPSTPFSIMLDTVNATNNYLRWWIPTRI